jgi:sulfur dioxygenase
MVLSVLGVRAKPAVCDLYIGDEESLRFGRHELRALATPGHTRGCTTFVLSDNSKAFTGDALLIRGCGRTDFQHGRSDHLYDSVTKKIFTLPDSCEVYPAHDYNAQKVSSVGEERRLNPRFTKSKSEFIKLMAELKMAYPARIKENLHANRVCGYVAGDPNEVCGLCLL